MLKYRDEYASRVGTKSGHNRDIVPSKIEIHNRDTESDGEAVASPVVISSEKNSEEITPAVPFSLQGEQPKNGKRPKKQKPENAVMTSEQADWYREYMTEHPKGDLQVKSSTRLFAMKVHDRAVFEWLMTELRRQKCGDTTYMLGPWKWLEDQLERYAKGLINHHTSAPFSSSTRNDPTREASRILLQRLTSKDRGYHEP